MIVLLQAQVNANFYVGTDSSYQMRIVMMATMLVEMDAQLNVKLKKVTYVLEELQLQKILAFLFAGIVSLILEKSVMMEI